MFVGDFVIITQYLRKALREVVCLDYWHQSFHLSAESIDCRPGARQRCHGGSPGLRKDVYFLASRKHRGVTRKTQS